MPVCIQNIAKNAIVCPKVGFLAPACEGVLTVYYLTTQQFSFKLTPQFQEIIVHDLDAQACQKMKLEDFCQKFLDPLEAIVMCVGADETCSAQQLVNDIQIFQADQDKDDNDVVYQNDRLDHGQTCNSIHWHYQRTTVSVNKNSPLLCNLPSRNFAACYLPKARFTEMPGLNLDKLCLCQGQMVDDIGQFCKQKAVGLVPWRKRLPLASSNRLHDLSKTDWYVGTFVLIIAALALTIVYTKHKGKVCYC